MAQINVRWTPLALEGMSNAYDYIADERIESARNAIVRVDDILRSLRHYPELGRPGRIAGTRDVVVVGTPFIIPYRIKNRTIELLAFIHGVRRWPDGF